MSFFFLPCQSLLMCILFMSPTLKGSLSKTVEGLRFYATFKLMFPFHRFLEASRRKESLFHITTSIARVSAFFTGAPIPSSHRVMPRSQMTPAHSFQERNLDFRNLNLLWWVISRTKLYSRERPYLYYISKYPGFMQKEIPSLSSKAAHYPSILEKMVQNEEQPVPHSQDVQKCKRAMERGLLTHLYCNYG